MAVATGYLGETVDVINMSLGSSFGGTSSDDPLIVAQENAAAVRAATPLGGLARNLYAAHSLAAAETGGTRLGKFLFELVERTAGCVDGGGQCFDRCKVDPARVVDLFCLHGKPSQVDPVKQFADHRKRQQHDEKHGAHGPEIAANPMP